jgi:hypothetical protein
MTVLAAIFYRRRQSTLLRIKKEKEMSYSSSGSEEDTDSSDETRPAEPDSKAVPRPMRKSSVKHAPNLEPAMMPARLKIDSDRMDGVADALKDRPMSPVLSMLTLTPSPRKRPLSFGKGPRNGVRRVKKKKQFVQADNNEVDDEDMEPMWFDCGPIREEGEEAEKRNSIAGMQAPQPTANTSADPIGEQQAPAVDGAHASPSASTAAPAAFNVAPTTKLPSPIPPAALPIHEVPAPLSVATGIYEAAEATGTVVTPVHALESPAQASDTEGSVATPATRKTARHRHIARGAQYVDEVDDDILGVSTPSSVPRPRPYETLLAAPFASVDPPGVASGPAPHLQSSLPPVVRDSDPPGRGESSLKRVASSTTSRPGALYRQPSMHDRVLAPKSSSVLLAPSFSRLPTLDDLLSQRSPGMRSSRSPAP